MKDSALDSEEVGHEAQGHIDLRNLLDEEGHVAKLAVPGGDSVHLGVEGPEDLVVVDDDELSFVGHQQFRVVGVVRLEFLREDLRHRTSLLHGRRPF